MPAKRSTGTTRRAPLQADSGVKLYGPTTAKPYFRVVAMGQVERASVPVPRDLLGPSKKVKFTLDRLDPATARARREADELFDQMLRWAKHQTAPVAPRDRTLNALCDRRLAELRNKGRAMTTIEQNEGLMRLYVRPVIGHVNVADWNTEHSLAVLRKTRETCAAERWPSRWSPRPSHDLEITVGGAGGGVELADLLEQSFLVHSRVKGGQVRAS